MTRPSNSSTAISDVPVQEWTYEDVMDWAKSTFPTDPAIHNMLSCESCLDGELLMELTWNDVRDLSQYHKNRIGFLGMKKFWLRVRLLQLQNAKQPAAMDMMAQQPHGAFHPPNDPHEPQVHSDASPLHGYHASQIPATSVGYPGSINGYTEHCRCSASTSAAAGTVAGSDCENITPPMSIDGRAMNIPPEFFKTAISLGYSFLVTWITSFVMVIVHERVPDMKRYPPLPDIFLDNVPHIPWAFHMCEITGTLLCLIWTCVCIFHKYRMVLLRRFFALAGTVFLLRCVTMLITSLSVPGTHLQCNQKDYAVDDTELTVAEALELRISRAYTIWSGLGMSIQGVRTCGDYMFSGHTVALTLLNFFITEYTPRNLYFLHTLTWLLNMFGIFFILAAHEHYSIDVFVAFYITSRLFLYYHTLANNQALMSRDSNRTRIWFPMFSYFESSVDGIIPNEYDTVTTLLNQLLHFILSIKDSFMLTTRRFWIHHPISTQTSKHTRSVKQKNVATSTNVSACSTPTQSLNSVDMLQTTQVSSVSNDTDKKDL